MGRHCLFTRLDRERYSAGLAAQAIQAVHSRSSDGHQWAYKASIQHGLSFISITHPNTIISSQPTWPTFTTTQTHTQHYTMNVFESPMYKATGFRLPLLPKIVMMSTAMIVGAAMVDRHVTPLSGHIDRRHWNEELVRLEVSQQS
jgi:hypothetical protein